MYTGTDIVEVIEGSYIGVYEVDSSGQVKAFKLLQVTDLTPPVTLAVLNPAEPSDWYRSDVTVTLIANDQHSSVAVTEYRFSEEIAWLTYDQPIVISQEGTNTLIYRSIDQAGNVEAEQPLVIQIDKTVPAASVSYAAIDNQTRIATIVFNEPVTITNNGGSAQRHFYFNGSFVFEFVDRAGNTGTAVAAVADIMSHSTAKPGMPVLSDNIGHDTGLLDGDYTISTHMWYGENARLYSLFENDVLIDRQVLDDRTPQDQMVMTAISGKSNGTYTYNVEFTNAFGTTRSHTHTVTVTHASPGKPILSHDNWDGDGHYTVQMNMWWGTNGTSYTLYENNVLIHTAELTANTPQAQAASITLSNRGPGVYEYRAELINGAGTATSERMAIHVLAP